MVYKYKRYERQRKDEGEKDMLIEGCKRLG